MIVSATGSIDDVLTINASITEWDRHFTREEFEKYLENKEALIIIGKVDDKPAGFIVGYADNDSIKTWVVGVDPKYRGRGVLKSMHDYLENYMKSRGLLIIKSDVALRRKRMIKIKAVQGYKVVGFEYGEDLPNSRLFFEKYL